MDHSFAGLLDRQYNQTHCLRQLKLQQPDSVQTPCPAQFCNSPTSTRCYIPELRWNTCGSITVLRITDVNRTLMNRNRVIMHNKCNGVSKVALVSVRVWTNGFGELCVFRNTSWEAIGVMYTVTIFISGTLKTKWELFE